MTAVVPYDADTDLRAMAARYLGDEEAAGFVEGMRETVAKGTGIKVSCKPERWLSADYEAT